MRGACGDLRKGQKHRTPSHGRGSESAPTRTRTWNPLIKSRTRSRHCELGRTASAIAVESCADTNRICLHRPKSRECVCFSCTDDSACLFLRTICAGWELIFVTVTNDKTRNSTYQSTYEATHKNGSNHVRFSFTLRHPEYD